MYLWWSLCVCVCVCVRAHARGCMHVLNIIHVFVAVCQWKKPGQASGERMWVRFLRIYIYCYFNYTFLSPCVKDFLFLFWCFVYWWIIKIDLICFDLYLIFTCMPGERYCRQLRSLLLCLYDIFQALINSLLCWFWPSFCFRLFTPNLRPELTIETNRVDNPASSLQAGWAFVSLCDTWLN